MSFQGDVAGIGLGELLQSLARGGKDGVLKLYGADLAAHLGVENGLLYLLESPEESEEEFTRRCEAAWTHDPDPTLVSHRKSVIARAERMEIVFSMLEASSLHFRFEPGPLPLPRGMRARRANVLGENAGAGEGNPWGRGMGVEAMLLEHARIADESSGMQRPSRYAVPRRLDGGLEPAEAQLFVSHCDGQSSINEIADRLGWPLRQAQGIVNDLIADGQLRLAGPHELLALANLELESGRERRAGERIQGWMELAPPGPLYQADAELLVTAWESGQLGPAMKAMPMGRARELVRKLDLLSHDLFEQLDRWEDLADYHPSDSLARFKRAALRVTALSHGHEIEGGKNELVMECLRIARGFSDQQYDGRARVMLLFAATTQPDTPQTRTELGARLIEVGLEDEGAAWMIEAAQDLIKEQDYDKAAQVLGALLKGVPGHREAQALLVRTRSRMTRSRKRRKHGIVALAGALAVSMVAVVQVHGERERERRFALVTDSLGEPKRALELLGEHFPGDESSRITALRSALEQRLRDQDRVLRREWQECFDATQDEITKGTAVAAFERIVELPRPPRLHNAAAIEWGTQRQLLDLLVVQLERQAEVFSTLPIEAEEEELQQEAQLILDIDTIRARCAEVARDPFDDFEGQLQTLHTRAVATRVGREQSLVDARENERQLEQDQLLALARFQRGSGQFDEAVSTYAELLALDASGQLDSLLTDEIAETESWRDAVDDAHELAEVGEHQAAIERLSEAGLDPTKHPLRWRVVSDPVGASVRLSTGETRQAPFVMETPLGRELELHFELAGCESQSFTVAGPGDLVARMHRSAERSWPSDFRVEAVPVQVGGDHVVADRQGRIERIAPDGTVRWSVTVDSLAGIARTPQFLPRLPGQLLVLGEDGQSWLCDAATGSIEGPHDLGSPILDGPFPITTGIAATFENGTYAIWSDGLDPIVRPTSSREALGIDRDSPYDEGNPNVVVLRSGRGLPNELANPWNQWTVEVHDEYFLVERSGADTYEFTIRRTGSWSFVAWEMPSSVVPAGRLWISDDEGLRSTLPTVFEARPDDVDPSALETTADPAVGPDPLESDSGE